MDYQKINELKAELRKHELREKELLRKQKKGEAVARALDLNKRKFNAKLRRLDDLFKGQ